MKILFVSPSNAIGGAEMSLLQMAKYLHGQGHAVFVAMPASTDKHYEQLLQPFVEAFLFVPLMAWNRITGLGFFAEIKGWMYRIYQSRGGWLHAPFRIARFVRQHNIELIHTNTIMALDGAFAAKMVRVPHIQHLREITGYGPEALFPMLGQRWPVWFGRMWGGLHKTCVANSWYTQKAYIDYLPGAKIRVAYNTVEVGHKTSHQHIFPPLKTIGLIANVTSKVKNHRLFIQLAGKLSQERPSLNFVVFGKMPPENDLYLQTLKTEIEHQNLFNKLVFKGICLDADVMYAQIDVLCHMYPYESFGRIFIEAMAHGKPVIAVRGGGADELISEGENGFLFDINDLETAATQVSALCEDPLLYARIAQNGQAFARQFHIEKTGAALLDIYREIIG